MRPESTTDRIATIIQEGHTAKLSSFEVAQRICAEFCVVSRTDAYREAIDNGHTVRMVAKHWGVTPESVLKFIKA